VVLLVADNAATKVAAQVGWAAAAPQR
jgi:hypothetical protein